MDRPLETETRSESVEALLRRAARRLVILKTIQASMWGAIAGLAIAVCLVVAHRVLAPQWELTVPVSSVLLGLPLLSALATYLFSTRDSFRAAIAVEQHYALHERLSSILFLQKEHVPDESAHALIRDGERHVEKIDLDKALPFPRLQGAWSALALCALFTGVIVFLPTFDLMGAAAKREDEKTQREAVDVRKKVLEKRLSEIRKKAEEKKVTEETKKLLAELARRKKVEKVDGDRKKQRRQALVDLDKMRQKLESRRGRGEMKRLEKYKQSLEAQAGMKLENKEMKDVAKALTEGNLDNAAAMLKKLAQKMKSAKSGKTGEGTKLDAAALASLMRDMDKLAPMLKDLPGLGRLSKGLEGLSPEDLAKLSKEASDQLEQLARLMSEQELLDQALEEISYTEEELAALPEEWPDESELCEDCKKAGQKPGGL